MNNIDKILKDVEEKGYAEIDMMIAPCIGTELSYINKDQVYTFVIVDKIINEPDIQTIRLVRTSRTCEF